MKTRPGFLKFLSLLTIATLAYPIYEVSASYEPIEGRISYLTGVRAATTFQENLFNNNDTQAKLGRSQSFDLVFQILGDLDEKSSLMAELTVGRHEFYKETSTLLDQFLLHGVSFDLGYRRLIGGRFWWSLQIGSLYPWHIKQEIDNQPDHPSSDFTAIYSTVLGFQYESTIKGRAVSYDLRLRKYMSSHLNDQASVGFGIGWRFH